MANELTTDIKGSKTSPAEEREHEIALFAKRVTVVGANQQTFLAYDSDGNVEYVGKAARGLASSSVGWLLNKLTYSSGNLSTVKVAYDSWDNRTTATYS